MKTLLTLFLILGLPLVAISAPYLVCDCQTDFQGEYVLVFDGGSQILTPADQYDCPVGQVRISFDVAPLNLLDGQHHLEGWAKNVWGESTHVPFDFNKIVPGTQGGIGLSPNP